MPIRNPNWTREEALLALDVFIKGATPESIHDLSEVLRQATFHSPLARAESFMNFDGVKRRINEFKRIRAGRLQGVRPIFVNVWREFEKKPELLSREAEKLRARITG